MIDDVKKRFYQRGKLALQQRYKIHGLTLLEVGLAVGVGAMVIGSALYFYKSSVDSSTAFKLTNLTSALIGACQSESALDAASNCTTAAVDSDIPSIDATVLRDASTGVVTVKYTSAPKGKACTKLTAEVTASIAGATTDCTTTTIQP